MSMKIVLKKLTSMVLVICMFVSLAAPAVGEAPLSQPPEEVIYPDGTIVYADGTLVYADGTIVYVDGTIMPADGATVDVNGTTVYPDGTSLYVDGRLVYADGTTAYPDGTTVYADGTVVYADGTIVYADGTTVYVDGATVYADGTTVYPDGTTVYVDGRIVYADGTTVYPDGTTVYADGTVVYTDGTIVYADGTTVYSDGATVNADGTTVYPDGTTLYVDGTMVYADGTTAYPDGTMVYADGTTVKPDGTTVYTDGTMVYADGTTVKPDGTTVYTDGTTVNPDGTTVYPDGTMVYADGTTVNPDGTTVYTDGTTVNPDGTTVYPDGTMVYADGTTVKPDGTMVYPDGTTVNPDGTTVYPDGTVVYADGTAVNPDGTIVYADGTTQYPDGTIVYPDGTTVNPAGTTVYADGMMTYPEGSVDSVPEEEPLPAVEPLIPDTGDEAGGEYTGGETTQGTEPGAATEETVEDPAEETIEETTEEPAEATTEETAEETSEETAEETKEETEEETEEKTAEKTTEDTTEETTEETTAPTEEFPLRTLTVSADQMAFRDQYLNPREPLLWSAGVWNGLYGSAIEPEYTGDHVTVEISGHIPETVTARAMFAEFADPGAEKNAERALMLLDVALLDETGAFYVPAEKLHVSVGAGAVSAAASDGEPFVAYFDDGYDGVGEAGAVRVLMDESVDGSRLAYAPEQGGRLTAGNGTIEFDEDRFPFRFVLSAQQAEVHTEAQTGSEAPAKDIMLSGTLVASDGYTYEVSVSYPADCGIPVGAELSVEELLLGTDAYWAYINQSAAELGVSPADLSLARAFDISLVDPATGVRYQPTQDVQVSILLLSTPVNTEEEISVLHFDDEAGEVQSMDVALNGEAIEFETNGFSVFVVLQRVIEKNLTAGDGYTYHITVDYDSASGIPEGVELEVNEIREGDAGYNDYVARSAAELGEKVENLGFARAFDISLVDPATGTYYQPNKNVKVSIQILNESLSDYESIDVVHFGNDVEVMNANIYGETVEFSTDGFSIFVLTGTTHLCTYYFYSYNSFGEYQGYYFVDDQGNLVSSQMVKNGERLVAPYGMPVNPNDPSAEFKGWYVGTGNPQNPTLANEPFDFDAAQSSGDTEISLYAVFRNYAYVTLHGQYDGNSQTYPVLETIRTELDNGSATVDLSDNTVPYYSFEDKYYQFYGWSITAFPTPGEGTGEVIDNLEAYSVSGDVDLYPVFKAVHRLTLSTGTAGTGATYYSPVTVPAGEPLTETEIRNNYVPTRPGYSFQGWYLDAGTDAAGNQNGTGTPVTAADGTLTGEGDAARIHVVSGEPSYLLLSTDVTLYAKWAAAETDYTILIWRQRATDQAEIEQSAKNYDWAESFSLKALPYESVAVDEDYKNLNAADSYNRVHPDSTLITGDTNPYKGYELNQTENISDTEPKSISFEGTTVFNLYYNWTEEPKVPGMDPHTLTFMNGTEVYYTDNDVEAGTSLVAHFPAGIPENKEGYDFHWYLDSTCTTEVTPSTTMPDHDLTVYAGWEKQSYLIQIDPNYGALASYDTNGDLNGEGSTYFWKTYQSDYIQEYTWVTRDYVESESGNYYYVLHDNEYNSSHSNVPDRWSYYTTDISEATELKTFKKDSNTYLYDGWYQVNDDGTETPYAFGKPITGNTKLRLHWKIAGTYYLQYNTDVTVDGERLQGTISEDSVLPDVNGYRDQASITIGVRALAPEEYAFVGWTVRGDESGKLYYPGNSLALPGEYAVTVNGKKTVYLDAVYQKVKTAKIIYDANGGTISDSADGGYPYQINPDGTPVMEAGTEAPANLNSHRVRRDTANAVVTVSGLVNNSPVRLSSGEGFTAPADSEAALSGWNTEPDGSGDHYDLGAYQDSEGAPVYVDINEPVTLYAEWKIRVYFNQNDVQYHGAQFSASGWEDYTLEDSGDHAGEYYIETYVNAKIQEPVGMVETEDLSFDFWSTEADGSQINAFDFSDTELPRELTLYAHLTGAAKIPYHVVTINKVRRDDWRNTDTLRVTSEGLNLTDGGALADYVTAENGYDYSYACLSADESAIDGTQEITEVKVAGNSVTVTMSDNTESVLDKTTGKDDQGRSIHLVYSTDNADKWIKLAYVMEGENGALSPVVGKSNTVEGVEYTISYNNEIFDKLNSSLVTGGILSSQIVANGAIDNESNITGQVLTLGEAALEISQRSGTGVFNLPPLLDNQRDLEKDPPEVLTLVFDNVALGASDAGNISDVFGNGKQLYLRYYDGKRQWSEDNVTWTTFHDDTLYVIYRQRGFVLEITKAVTGDNTGINAEESFDVTVTSTAITQSDYNVEGTGYNTIAAVPASGSTPGSINLTVKDGSDIKISGLGSGSYTITEKHESNYTLGVRINNTNVDVTDSTSVSLNLDQDQKVELINEPKVICRILDAAAGGYKTFYTLNKALEYAGSSMDGEAEIQMLQDYVMPSWDTLEIPAGYAIALTSAGETKQISRNAETAKTDMVTNYGTLTLNGIVLDGGGTDLVAGSAMVQNYGDLTVGNGALLQNAYRAAGSGGAINQKQGTLTIETGAGFNNNVSEGIGGAIYVDSGILTIEGGAFSHNTAGLNGGAVYYGGSDSVTISDGTFSDNDAGENGGAFYAAGGSTTISGGVFTGNDATNSGGAVYVDRGTVTLTGGTIGGSDDSAKNTAENGAAIYVNTGSVAVSGGSIAGNKALANGGAIYSKAGSVSITGGTIAGNTASSGYGGAVYAGSGTVEMSGGTIGGDNNDAANSALNGAGIYINTASATFTGGTVKGNTASNGGAVGIGSADARIFFSGNINISGNMMNGNDSNLYLDQDSDAVINIAGLGANAGIGVYVADNVLSNRGVPGAKFASYTNDTNKGKVTNDRDQFSVVSETDTKKLFWGKAISIEVRYQSSYASEFPPNGTSGSTYQVKKSIDTYYPVMGEDGYVAISALAEDLYKNYSLNLGSTTAAYGGAWRSDAASYDQYVTRLTWDTAAKEWKLIQHDNTTTIELTSSNKLVVYYAEPAYISIENNTDMTLSVSSLSMIVNGSPRSVINNETTAGYGMVYAKNGAVRPALLPITADDLTLNAGSSVNLLIPGGQNMAYTLDGNFETTEAGSVKLRRGPESSLIEVQADYDESGVFTQLTGNTLSGSGTYQIIFGDDKVICKVVDADGEEHPYSKISAAIAAIKDGTISLATDKTATIEMVTDYLLPASDYVLIPRGYDITLTTAEKSGCDYPYTGEEDCAIISRDSENTESMIDAWNDANKKDTVNSLDNTKLTLQNLVFDGKSVRGSSDGGALKSKYVNVYVDNVDFKNVYASNGGAMLVMFSAKDKNPKATVPGTILEVRDSTFVGCTSTTTETSNRLGGGAIVTNAETMTLENCVFDTCTAVDQAGAVFHRVDGNYSSYTYITGCTFTNCRANAAGGLELDSKTIIVTDCTFEHCVATQRNGGGFNVWALNDKNGLPTADCWVNVRGCTFNDCQLTATDINRGNGGGFRSNAVYNTIEDCTFTNNTAIYGGGISLSNTNAKADIIRGCSFERCTATGNGGGIYSKAKTLTIEDYTSGGITRRTEVKNCTSKNDGAGIYHDNNGSGSGVVITNATIQNNTSANGAGGGIRTNARTVDVTGSKILDNRAKGNGGGISSEYNSKDYRLTVDSTQINNNRSGGQGGGIYNLSQLTLKNNTIISGNRLSSKTATAEDAAGVYVPNSRTLTVGTAGALTADTTTVKDNITESNVASDVRLATSGTNNAADSVSVLCDLSGEIRVVNPGAAGTQFGTRTDKSFTGFTEEKHVFIADSGVLYGVYDRNDTTEKKLIWRGDVICKITDENGHLLYLDQACTDPAVFDRLDDSKDGSKVSPFSYFRQNDSKVLFYRKGEDNSVDLTSEKICIKMLVSSFETARQMVTHTQNNNHNTWTGVIMTTAGITDPDNYPYTGRAGSYATIKRSYTAGNSLITTGFNLTLKNITLDGGAADKTNPLVFTANGGLINANVNGITVTLGANSVLQNAKLYQEGKAFHGAGVYVNNGAALTIAGGAIYNCSTVNGEGGAVNKNGTGSLTFSSGIISRCSAVNGGGIYYANGSEFTLSGTAQITGCEAAESGGGVYLNNQKTMTMSGGSITGNYAGTSGGGIFLKYLNYHNNSRLYFSGRVVVSGNTAGEPKYDCNVQLGTADDPGYTEQESNWKTWNGVINSSGLSRNSNIGIYVPGENLHPEVTIAGTGSHYEVHGKVSSAFGKFTGDTNYLYCFVNDRNGLKGGLQIGDTTYIHWVEIFSLKVAKTVVSSESSDLTEEFKFNVIFSTTEGGQPYYYFNSSPSNNCYFVYDGAYPGKTDEEGNPKSISIEHGTATFTLRTGESITVSNLPAEIDNGHVYYKVEEVLTEPRKSHYTTSTFRSTNPGAIGDLSVSGIIGENLNKTDVTSKYVSNAFFDNLNAICKLTSSINGGVLLNTLDSSSGNYVPAVYSALHNNANTGAFDVINAKTNLYYYNAFTNRYEQYAYSGDDTLSIEMLIEEYDMTKPATLNNTISATLTTASSDAKDGYPYVGTSGSQAAINRTESVGNNSMFTAEGNLTFSAVTLDGKKMAVSTGGGIAKVTSNGKLTVADGAILRNSDTNSNGGAVLLDKGTMNMTGGTITGNSTKGYGGGAVRVQNGAVLTVSGGEISDNTVTNANANGGAISIKKGTVSITGGIISNNVVNGAGTGDDAKATGGAIYVSSEGRLSISGGEISHNSVVHTDSTARGGAVYVDSDNKLIGKMTLTGGIFNRNTATTDGAAIYLSENSLLNLSGSPVFGAAADANTVLKTNYADRKNGGESVYTGDYVRQDIFIAEKRKNAPATVVIKGDLRGEEGSIWVWADNEEHYKQLMPFAKLDDGVVFAENPTGSQFDSTHLKVFRNAQDDDTTENSTDTWLYGTIEGGAAGYVYWSGVSGSRKVILRKVDSTYASMSDISFTIYKGSAVAAYQPKDETRALEGLLSGPSGCFWIGNLPFGWYIVKEGASGPYFYIVITESGTYGTLDGEGKDIVGGFTTRIDAESAAEAKYNELK